MSLLHGDTNSYLPSIKDMVEQAIKDGIVKSIEDFTCYDCPLALSSFKTNEGIVDCPVKFDWYNTNGECLFVK